MKILGIHSVNWGNTEKESAVDIWRIWRPLEELKKHVDWQIDYQATFVKDIEQYKDKSEFTEEELEKAAQHLGQYDIVFSSYHPDPTAFALLRVVHDRYGTEFVLDIDDNMFAIDEDNPFWTKVDDWGVFVMQQMIRSNKWITTTTDHLKSVMDARRQTDGKVFTLPNRIADSYKEYSPDNGDKVVIGYFGGASHYGDLNETNILPALQRVMHDHKNVHFHTFVPFDYYLPKQRVKTIDGKRGQVWPTKLFPTLGFDISIAPLRQSIFNDSKSDIKWQESARMGAAFVCSNIGPYKELKDDTAVRVNNTEEEWYDALTLLVESAEKRQKLVKAARQNIQRLEDNWQPYKEMFEEVYHASH